MVYYSKDDTQIEQLSKRFSFSIVAVETLYQMYGSRTVKILERLKIPSPRYFIRGNTLIEDIEITIERLEASGLEVEQDPSVPEALSMSVEGPFDLPETSKNIVADRIAAESVMQGANLYAPGVVNCKSISKNDILTVIDNLGNPVAVGKAQMNEQEILTLRSGLAVETVISKYQVPDIRHLNEYTDGLIYVQSLPAILASRILNPRQDETIIDLCSSPGGKISHIAQLMKNRGNLIAIDRSPRKMKRIRSNLNRLRIKNVKLMQEDSRYLDLKFPELKADRILIDPPCSALGLRPRLSCNIRQNELSSFPAYQIQFFRPAVKILKEGGTILYSTCTLTLSENEQLIDRVTEKYGLKLVEQPLFLGSQGMAEFECSERVQRFHPDIDDTCGFFIALLRKGR
jgi:predicted RNA-binding protein (TIGR00451 family)